VCASGTTKICEEKGSMKANEHEKENEKKRMIIIVRMK
jgi:hypothetical protein